MHDKDAPTKNCGNCAFGINDEGGVFCRFNPPVPYAVIAMPEAEDGQRILKIVSQYTLWPLVKRDWWCGQHVPEAAA